MKEKIQKSEALLVEFFNWAKNEVPTYRIKDLNTDLMVEHFLKSKQQLIPITAEWLESFDFLPLYGKGMGGCDVFQRGRYRILFHRDRREYSMCMEGISPPTYVINNAELKYVHQLQNLFFALTGEDLTTESL